MAHLFQNTASHSPSDSIAFYLLVLARETLRQLILNIQLYGTAVKFSDIIISESIPVVFILLIVYKLMFVQYFVHRNASRTGVTFGAGSGQIWLDNVKCPEDATDLRQCTHSGWGVHSCTHTQDVGIVCNTGLSP